MRDIIYNQGKYLQQNFLSQWLSLEPQGPFVAFPHECSSSSNERLLEVVQLGQTWQKPPFTPHLV